MGTPHTIDICGNCHEPVIQWNNTGAWEHLNSANMDQAQSRSYASGAKSLAVGTPGAATTCVNPKLKIEQDSVASRTTANYRTAKKKA